MKANIAEATALPAPKFGTSAESIIANDCAANKVINYRR